MLDASKFNTRDNISERHPNYLLYAACKTQWTPYKYGRKVKREEQPQLLVVIINGTLILIS